MDNEEMVNRFKQLENDIAECLIKMKQALEVQHAQQMLFAAVAQQAEIHVNTLRQFLKERGIAPPN